jgi:hypothetical protein
MDPHDIVERVPPGASLNRIVDEYKLADEALKCGLPSCRQPHKQGYIVELSDGRQARVGHICGKQRFGNGWREKVAEHRRDRKRQAFRRRVAPMDALAREALDALASWNSPIRQLDDFARELRQFDDLLYPGLEKAVTRHEGKLIVQVPIPSTYYVGERQYREEVHGHFDAPALFAREGLTRKNYTPVLQSIARQLTRFRHELASNDPSDTELKALVQKLNVIVHRLERLKEVHDQYRRVMTLDVWRRVALWANRRFEYGGAYYGVLSAAIFRRKGGILELPLDPAALDNAPIDILKRRPDLEMHQQEEFERA